METRNDLELLDKVMSEIRDKLLSKGADYTKSGIVDPEDKHGLSAELLTYMGLIRKFTRLENFYRKGVLTVKDETVEDTVEDLAGYAILYVMLKRLKKNEQKIGV